MFQFMKFLIQRSQRPGDFKYVHDSHVAGRLQAYFDKDSHILAGPARYFFRRSRTSQASKREGECSV